MPAIGFDIFIFVTLRVPVSAQVDGALIEKIGISHAHPVKLRLAGEELSRLSFKLGIGLNLVGKRILIPSVGQMQTGRE